MLTEREWEWLKRRKELPGYFCQWCPLWEDEADCDGIDFHPFCPMFQRRERLYDALLFASRVNEILAPSHYKRFLWPEERLKQAQFQVEEEMERIWRNGE